jgi:P4 family phage/plasmid primase-like protien
MNNMITSQFKDLSEFMIKHSSKANNQAPSHTRIADTTTNIYGGAYTISKEELPLFYSLYYDHIFVNKKKEYLTEKQLENTGPLLVDFDFRYHYDVTKRQHTNEHIQDMIILYLEELKKYFIFNENTPFDIFIFEKPNVNRLEDKSLTKDGIHMLIGIQIDHTMQMMIRDNILQQISETWELPLINSWESVLDEGISKGSTNWQLFGSRKPNNEAYELTQHYLIEYDKNDSEFMMSELKVKDFNLKNNFYKLTAQNNNNPIFEINPKILDLYNKKLETKNTKIKKPSSKTKLNLLIDDSDEENYISINEIDNLEKLNKAINNMLKSLKPGEYEINEIHEYTQILPAKYYEPGSHLLNRQVAFALKHTDERLFLSWVLLRSKASDFDYNTIPQLYSDWNKYFNTSKESITKRSIMYWAKQDAFDDYIRVKKSTIDYYIEESFNTQTEFDLAQVLKQMYKDKYVCISYANKGSWYIFKNHRWEPDKGISLRLAISTEMYELYTSKIDVLQNEYNHYDPNDERAAFIRKRLTTISDLKLKLKKTNDKNNILREAMELFYDEEFSKNMDKNKFLLCFNNGVIDFKNKIFRDGYPQDYITKSTKINYSEYNFEKMKTISEEILSFMEKLFPIASLNQYMWDHLASCLIGTKPNQTFNVYHGSGSNGKSVLADLMSVTLGEYKGTVPITLVTEKRNGIGGTSSELIQLKGIRYAVMQEPSKGVKLHEGTMKELTGGDPLLARALYSESEIFEPQFSLVVCTNNLFDIDSNDDGTWRRIRKVDFLSKFIDENEKYTDDTKYIFPKDKFLKEKLPLFAPIFASMLVKRAFETDGVVKDCDIVLTASNNYRNGQDHISDFVNKNIEKTGCVTDKIKKTELANHFKFCFSRDQGSKKIPKCQELYEYMDKKFGIGKSSGWEGVKIIYPDQDEIVELTNL